MQRKPKPRPGTTHGEWVKADPNSQPPIRGRTPLYTSTYSGYRGTVNNWKEKLSELPHLRSWPNKAHLHTKLPFEEIMAAGPARDNIGKLFVCRGHDAPDVAELIERSCDLGMEDWPPWLQNASDNIFHNGCQFGIDRGIAVDPQYSEKIARSFIRHFDQIFFFGILEDRIKLSVTEHAYWGHAAIYDGGRILEMHVTPLDEQPSKNSYNCVNYKVLISVVLHEMIHAFLMLLSCDIDNCHGREEAGGPKCHGEAFCRIARAIDSSSARKDLIESRHDALMEAFPEMDSRIIERSALALWLYCKKWKYIWKWRKFLGGHHYPPYEVMPFKDRVKRRLRHTLPASEKTWDNIHSEDFFLLQD